VSILCEPSFFRHDNFVWSSLSPSNGHAPLSRNRTHSQIRPLPLRFADRRSNGQFFEIKRPRCFLLLIYQSLPQPFPFFLAYCITPYVPVSDPTISRVASSPLQEVCLLTPSCPRLYLEHFSSRVSHRIVFACPTSSLTEKPWFPFLLVCFPSYPWELPPKSLGLFYDSCLPTSSRAPVMIFPLKGRQILELEIKAPNFV